MEPNLNDKKIGNVAKKTYLKYKLCDNCLGRIFAKVESGMTNFKRGEILRKNFKEEETVESKNCCLCSGLTKEIQHFVDMATDSLKAYDFDTFLIGTKVDEDIIQKEKEIVEFSKSEYSESIKTELNREIGKILEKKLGKEVEFNKPTIMVIIDTAFDVVDLQISSLYIYGRYNKYSREIPQTKWFCRICRGKGCRKCNYTGEIYKTSVEGLVSKPFVDETKGIDEAFHGAGREDIDVRMLGTGRPFVLEIKNPICRNIDLSKLGALVNSVNKGKIAVNNLRFCSKDEISRIKSAKFKKTYKLVFKGEKTINNEKLKKAVLSLRGTKIGQKTPSRVAHRRADMLREKQIYSCTIDSIDGAIATLTLEAESGTYIKELISGDDGRTKPNISELIGVPCIVTELDVIEVKGE